MRIKHIILLLTMFVAGGAIAQNQIEFTKGRWGKILRKARLKNKVIFVDAYTTWCGPCKMMDKNVFNNAEVADFFNENFMNVKIDMEKGDGPTIATQYNVKAYPTFLFIDSDGTLLHQGLGYHAPQELLELAKEALDPAVRNSGMKARYEKGDRDPDFLYEYTTTLLNLGTVGYEEVLNEYLKTQSNWKEEKNMTLIFAALTKSDSKLFEHVANNRLAYEKLVGKEELRFKIKDVLLLEAFEANANPDIKTVEKRFQEVYPEAAEQLTLSFKMDYYLAKDDWKKFSKAASNYYKKYPSDNSLELNNVAWLFYENAKKKSCLKQAAKWAEKSVALDEQYYNWDTLTHLYAKLGKKGKAKEAGKKAIAIAKQYGEDFSTTQRLINSL